MGWDLRFVGWQVQVWEDGRLIGEVERGLMWGDGGEWGESEVGWELRPACDIGCGRGSNVVLVDFALHYVDKIV